jgi:hypothetical protein
MGISGSISYDEQNKTPKRKKERKKEKLRCITAQRRRPQMIKQVALGIDNY